VRPEFFTDAIVSKLTPGVRLTYIGLWCVADDAGWMSWDVAQIGAQLYPYESVHVRERRIIAAGEALVAAGRLLMFECGCALIPKLEGHQRIGGNKSFTARDKHDVHTHPDKSAGSKGRLGNGTLVAPADAPEGAGANDESRPALLAAYRRQGLPVDVH
jgi:hypothetical protein